MADAAEIVDDAAPAKPRRKLGLILGVVGALALGGGGFYAVYAGYLDRPASSAVAGAVTAGAAATERRKGAPSVLGDVAFVPMEPIMVSLPPGASARHLRFAGQLEVAPEHAAEVAGLMPRVLDVLNTYLRAVEVRDLEEPRARPPARADAAAHPGGDRRGPGARPAHHRIRAELGNARMDLLMNGLLMAATLFAGGYCWVLARRVRELKSLDSGLGGSIVTLTRQVELARTTLEEARTASRDTRQDLAQLVAKADGAAGQLRLLIAAAPVPPPAAGRPRRAGRRHARAGAGARSGSRHPAGAAARAPDAAPRSHLRRSPSRGRSPRSRTRCARKEAGPSRPQRGDILEALTRTCRRR